MQNSATSGVPAPASGNERSPPSQLSAPGPVSESPPVSLPQSASVITASPGWACAQARAAANRSASARSAAIRRWVAYSSSPARSTAVSTSGVACSVLVMGTSQAVTTDTEVRRKPLSTRDSGTFSDDSIWTARWLRQSRSDRLEAWRAGAVSRLRSAPSPTERGFETVAARPPQPPPIEPVEMPAGVASQRWVRGSRQARPAVVTFPAPPTAVSRQALSRLPQAPVRQRSGDRSGRAAAESLAEQLRRYGVRRPPAAPGRPRPPRRSTATPASG